MKIITYTCDRCKTSYTSELKMGETVIEINFGGSTYKRWSIFSYQEHVCSNCLETLELAITSLVDKFVKVEE
jgi:hypothetical protein